MRNEEVAGLLEAIAAALELKPDNQFKVRAYQEAARSVSFLKEDVAEVWRQDRLTEIPGVGTSIAQKIAEFLATGRSTYLEQICDFPPAVLQLTRVPGIGPRKARMLHQKLGIMTLDDLARAAGQHRLCGIRGLGEKTEANILKELARLTTRSQRLLLGVVWPLADRIAATLRRSAAVYQAEPAGSIRRRKETIGDIDILVAADDALAVREYLRSLPDVREVLAAGPTKVTFLTAGDFQVDVRIVPPDTWGAALQYFTGSKAHNIALRERAIKRGYKLSEYGIFESETGRRVAGRTEEEVYDLLDLDWIPPELREMSGELDAAAAGRLPRLIEEADVKGDFHVHSKYSDGADTLEAMAVAARDRGYEYMAITDHSIGLGVAQGLDAAKARKQRAEVEDLNRKLAPFRILCGVELEIRSSGELDLPEDVLGEFDFATASLHVGTKQDAEKLTGRLITALRSPHVRVLNHPSGRLLGRRAPYEFDLDRVLEEARDLGKAVEINGAYDRMDLDDGSARRARELGVRLSLGSDAHSVAGLDGMRLAVAIARRAWCEPEDVLNTFGLGDLLRQLDPSPSYS